MLSAATTLLPASDPLRNLEYILRKIDDCAKVGGASEEHLSFLWLLTTRVFTGYVNEVMGLYMYIIIIYRCQGYKCVIKVIQSLPCYYYYYYTVGKGSS